MFTDPAEACSARVDTLQSYNGPILYHLTILYSKHIFVTYES